MEDRSKRLQRLAEIVVTAGHRDSIMDAAYKLYPGMTGRQALDALALDLRAVAETPPPHE